MRDSLKQVVILRPVNNDNGCLVLDPAQTKTLVGVPAGTYTVLRGLATVYLPLLSKHTSVIAMTLAELLSEHPEYGRLPITVSIGGALEYVGDGAYITITDDEDTPVLVFCTNRISDREHEILEQINDSIANYWKPNLQQAKQELGALRLAASVALYEMRHTVAQRNSFTDAVDCLDAALHPKNTDG